MGSSGYLPHTMKFEDSADIIRSIRSGEQPPMHYKLDVKSFLQIRSVLACNLKVLESTEFFVGGYRWVVQIYPNGNGNDNGEGYISIYLKLCDKLNYGSFINVIFRALVYDQQRDKYLVIQDLREKRFDATNPIWGMSKALPQAVFNATCNGFLVKDQCTFGAEVFIIYATTPTTAEVSSIHSSSTLKYTWRIEKFSELPDDIYSPEFTIEDHTWKLNVNPRGYKLHKGKSLSLYLFFTGQRELTAGSKLYIEYEMRVKNQLNFEDQSKTGTRSLEYADEVACAGIVDLIPISDLHNPSKGFVMDDVIILEVCIKRLFLLKTM
ncbi:hypothetical protein Ancab_028524 [Ancistrocladus abbreviatus]